MHLVPESGVGSCLQALGASCWTAWDASIEPRYACAGQLHHAESAWVRTHETLVGLSGSRFSKGHFQAFPDFVAHTAAWFCELLTDASGPARARARTPALGRSTGLARRRAPREVPEGRDRIPPRVQFVHAPAHAF